MPLAFYVGEHSQYVSPLAAPLSEVMQFKNLRPPSVYVGHLWGMFGDYVSYKRAQFAAQAAVTRAVHMKN